MNGPIVQSVLDTDFYKITQGFAIAKRYPRTAVRYKFFNRNHTPFPERFEEHLLDQIELMSELQLTDDEANYLSEKCGKFLDPPFIDFLKGYRFNPKEVSVERNGTDLSIDIYGPWYRTVYWEVPLMAIVSELYFKLAEKFEMKEEQVLTLQQSYDRAKQKGKKLAKHHIKFADFGTRRRFSFDNHKVVVSGLLDGADQNFVGTSNVLFAMNNDIRPIGTVAHEWFMVHAAKYGYRMANKMALGRWADIFGGQLGIALTDTFTTEAFFEAFDVFYAKLFDGVRHDSGDPIEFGEKAIEHYEKLKIDPKTKTIVFSDSLDIEKTIEIQEKFQERIKISFGIGTYFTNDVGVKPLNIVIKVVEAEFDNKYVPTIKLSDDKGKHTGSVTEIDLAKNLLRVD